MTQEFTETRAALLRRHGLIFARPGDAVQDARCLDAFEINMASYGYAISARLRQRLGTMSGQALTSLQGWAGKVLVTQAGGHQTFTPLFRRFPGDVPSDTFELWSRKVLSHFMQEADQPCLHCGRVGTTHVLNPCRHVVCGACFDGGNYSACPVCEHAVDRSSPFFKPGPERGTPQENVTLKLLDLGGELDAGARALFVSLCERKQVMSPADTDDFKTIGAEFGEGVLAWLPPQIPVRENIAHLFGALLRVAPAARVLQAAAPYMNTATDVVRLIAVYSGEDPSLQGKKVMRPRKVESLRGVARFKSWFMPGTYLRDGMDVRLPATISRFKVAPLARPLRRALLAFLDSLHPESLTEDMLRHRSYWVWLGQFLHPGEYKKRYPQVAAAFEIVRAKAPDGTPAAPFRTYYSRLEQAALSKQGMAMAHLLAQRPGELARRLDHALRVAGEDAAAVDALLDTFDKTAPRMSTPVLLTLWSLLPRRARPANVRIYWPKGKTAQGVFKEDKRPVLSAAAIERSMAAVEAELLQRFAALPHYEDMVIDLALADIMVPFNERTASRSALALPRGSTLPFEPGKNLRLFLHWCEPQRGGHASDLDLSVGFYDAQWGHMGTCSYYELTFAMGRGEVIARSAGDVRNAPYPDGASEFVDIDCGAALGNGVRYAVAVLNNYAGMPFGELEHAFAGLMLRDDVQGAHFDPRTVELKFDLQGDNGIFMPFVMDMEENRIHWLDVYSRGGFQFNNVASSNGAITAICPAMIGYFGSGVRTSMYSLGLLHAAARAQRVTLRGEDSSVVVREAGESGASFLRRLRSGEGWVAGAGEIAQAAPVLALLLEGDAILPEGSAAYVLKPGAIAGKLAASDLLS